MRAGKTKLTSNHVILKSKIGNRNLKSDKQEITGGNFLIDSYKFN